MLIPEHFTPMQKYIVEAYIIHRNTPMTAIATHHAKDSSFVREVIRKYKLFLVDNGRLTTAVIESEER